MTKRTAEVNKTAGLQPDREDQKRRREADGSGEPLPNYGTKDYWEDRYRTGVDDGSPEAGHCWYFSYSELRSLVLPLLLGSENHELCQDDLETDDDDVEEWVVEGEDEEDDRDEWVDAEGAESETSGATSEPRKQAGGGEPKLDDTAHEDGGEEEDGEDEDEDEQEDKHEQEEFNLDSAQNSIPKKVLEIGCGDVPMGSDLVDDLISMQSQSTKSAESVVDEVTCIDYSETVVQKLIKEHKGGSSQCKKSNNTLEVQYEIMDARKLPYDANSYDLIFEKGTMDAMLSDASEGVENCIQIVREMARVCSLGGSILIVSHLNANDPKGMGWLRDVVIRGLEREFQQRNCSKAPSSDDDAKEFVWFVSVNGGEGDVVDDEAEELGFRSTYGPAVYILTKKTITKSLALELYGKPRGDGSKEPVLDKLPPVKIEFVTH